MNTVTAIKGITQMSKTTIDMAREAGFNFDGMLYTVRGNHAQLAHLEALVRADEQEKYKWDIHSCGPTCKRYACVAMREAVEAEREACAQIAEEPSATTYECTVACGGPAQTFTQRMSKHAHEIAKEIRERGQA
jgi:hypothetical protein